ncbi:MAG: serine hydrolase [Candidatus Hydrogenedentota bacterium]
MHRSIASILTLATLAASSLVYAADPPLERIAAERVLTMLDEATRIENFRHIDQIFPVETIHRSGTPFMFKEQPVELDSVSFEWRGEKETIDSFLDKTVTTAFLVVKGDAIVFERYYRGNDKDSQATSMSVAKSYTSALVGIALAEGKIKSVDDPVTKYVPELNGSGYEGVPIKHLLQMSSGIDFSEVYEDQSSDIIVMVGQIAAGMSVNDYAKALKSQRKSGEAFNYASIDTNILGMLIQNATGKNVAEYLEEKIWSKLGMESDATWGMDNHGNVLNFAWLNVTARDYAKFGRLYLNKGNWNGAQIVPAEWVAGSAKPDKEYLKLKDLYEPRWDIGYQHQWWVPAGDEGEFTGIGVWGQYVYVNSARDLIIVKNSVDPGFGTRDMETVAAFRAIGEKLGK